MRQSEYITGLADMYPVDADDITLDKLLLLDILIGEAIDCLDNTLMSYGSTWLSLNKDITLNIYGDVPTVKRNSATAARDLRVVPSREPKLLSTSVDLLDKVNLPMYRETVRFFFRTCLEGKLVGIIKSANAVTIYLNEQINGGGNNFHIGLSHVETETVYCISNMSWLNLSFNVLLYTETTKPYWSSMRSVDEPKLATLLINRAITMFIRKRPDSLLLRQ